MDFQNLVETAVLKARHAFLNRDYQTVVDAVQSALAACGGYFRELPNYFQFSRKAQLIAFVSDALALQSIALLFLGQGDAALECIDASLTYLPESMYRIIRCAVLTGNQDYEAAISSLRSGCSILDREFLQNECGVSDTELRVFRLFASISTSDHQRTYRALAVVLSKSPLTANEYLAAEECARVASEQFHQTPIQLKCSNQLNYPGIGPGNQLVNLQELQFHCFQQYKRLGGDIERPGVLLQSHQIMEMCFGKLRHFRLAALEKYLDSRLFKQQFYERHASLSRKFMGMVKLSGNKSVKSDQPILTEQVLREYLWGAIVAKEGQNSASRSHSANSRSSSQSYSQINAQNERAAQELKRRHDAYLVPLTLFSNERRTERMPFTSTANIRALTSKNASMLRPSYHMNKTKHKAEFIVGNGQFDTTTRLINKTKADLSGQSVLKLYDRLPSNERFQRVSQPAPHGPPQNQRYNCGICKEKPNAVTQNGDRLAISKRLEDSWRRISERAEAELLSGELNDRRGAWKAEKADKAGKTENAENAEEAAPRTHSERQRLQERLRRVRALELSQAEDAILCSYKEKLDASQLLATNYDDFQAVLYVHGRPRPRRPAQDADFNDLFDPALNCVKSSNLAKIRLNLANLPKMGALTKFKSAYESFEVSPATDGDLDGRQLLERLRLFDLGQMQAFQAAAAPAGGAQKTPRPPEVRPARLKLQFDAAAAANGAYLAQNGPRGAQGAREAKKAPRRPQSRPAAQGDGAEGAGGAEGAKNAPKAPQNPQYKYFRAGRTSFLFAAQ